MSRVSSLRRKWIAVSLFLTAFLVGFCVVPRRESYKLITPNIFTALLTFGWSPSSLFYYENRSSERNSSFSHQQCTHLHLNWYASGKGNPFTLCSGPHTLHFFTYFGQAVIHLTLMAHFKCGILSFLLFHGHTKLIRISGLFQLPSGNFGYLSLKVSSLR